MVKRKNYKRRDMIQLVLSVVIIILINFIGSFVFKRFDLTSEKRYTLSGITKDMLKNLDDLVYVKVYLEGDFPAGFKRLRDETREMLDEFRAYAGDNIEYEFINPNDIGDTKQRNDFYRMLFQKGIIPTTLEVKEEKGNTQQIIFPGAMVSFRGREMPWQLLQTQTGVPPEEQLNNSVQTLEYELSNTIRKLNTPVKSRIAFIEDHAPLDSIYTADISDALSGFYEVRRVMLNEKIYSLTERDTAKGGEISLWNKYKMIIVAKPDSAFSEKNKFIIDQYIMNGGKVMWLLDPVYVNEDSLSTGFTLGIGNNLNLDDMLFKYGVRVNMNLVQDLQCAPIPINKAPIGAQPRWEFEPWLFLPLVQPAGNHPIVKNLDLIKLSFASSMDTIQTRGIRKTILLQSSRYSRLVNAPARIAVAMATIKPDERQFTNPRQPVAVLLEGEFESLYRNRLTDAFAKNREIAFKEKSKPSKMIVISDGDIIKNNVQRSTGQVFPLGYDLWTRQTFGNKNFILNCVNYLMDDEGLMSVRSREIRLRLLDKKKLADNALKTRWQSFNALVPVLVVIVFGMLMFYFRKRKYAK